MFSDLGHWGAMRSKGHCSDALAKYSTELHWSFRVACKQRHCLISARRTAQMGK
jgi:hypothetical protein